MRAQLQLMEFLVLAFFIVGLIFFIIIFMGGYQLDELDRQKVTLDNQKILAVAKQFYSTPLFSSEKGILQKERLDSFIGNCGQLQEIFSKGWFIQLTVLDGRPRSECSKQKADCNLYSFCKEERAFTSLDIPVNFESDRLYAANLVVGVYR